MGKNTAIMRGCAVLASLLICAIEPTGAASLLGGKTDDSVCDLGTTPENDQKLSVAGKFIREHCKNGQVLMGSRIAPDDRFADSPVERLAVTFCSKVEIHNRRIPSDLPAVTMVIADVRCTIDFFPDDH